MTALALELSWWCLGLLIVALPFTFWPARHRDDERVRRNYGRNA